MNSAGIFIYGCIVFAIVAAALGMIAWGIVQERRDRLALEAEQATPEGLALAQAARAEVADAEAHGRPAEPVFGQREF